ncbi:hypothetical protein GGR92_000846 [Spirosoma lacussanchae]|uniref:hypothetical protein n=1 Tax=Spirosoma lacussanchae TaxID=1884249 RepID=UPI0011096EA2|nr:hypothetical protein [Spirosoma lacussanchae]
MKALLLLLTTVALAACQDDALPALSSGDDALKTQLRGVWLPNQLQIKYQVGLIPNQRDTTITITPTTAPLLVATRPNVIMPFTDTLYIGTVATARIDTFFTRNRGLRQQGNFFLTTGVDNGAGVLRVARPTYTRGTLTRWNYDFVFHGTVLPNAQNQPAYSYTSYPNYPLTIREVSSNRLVISFQTTGNINNLPQAAITPANQNLNTTWAGRVGLITATFTKQ